MPMAFPSFRFVHEPILSQREQYLQNQMRNSRREGDSLIGHASPNIFIIRPSRFAIGSLLGLLAVSSPTLAWEARLTRHPGGKACTIATSQKDSSNFTDGLSLEQVRELQRGTPYQRRLLDWYAKPNIQSALKQGQRLATWGSCEMMSNFATYLNSSLKPTSANRPSPQASDAASIGAPATRSPRVSSPSPSLPVYQSGHFSEYYVCNSENFRIVLSNREGRIYADLSETGSSPRSIGRQEVQLHRTNNRGCLHRISALSSEANELMICLPDLSKPVLKGRMRLRGISDRDKSVHCEMRDGFDQQIRPYFVQEDSGTLRGTQRSSSRGTAQ